MWHLYLSAIDDPKPLSARNGDVSRRIFSRAASSFFQYPIVTFGDRICISPGTCIAAEVTSAIPHPCCTITPSF
ncbi:hypothetical protein I7I48_11510 [Histoplasma ohiense]|nr:hypothetical protein I7I48_11510 [Histoplasma ohiense (nom. inval.)]